MSSPKTWVAGLLVLALASSPRTRAQDAGAAAVPGGASTAAASGLGAAGGGAAAPAAAAPAAAPQTLGGFFGLSSSNIHACITKLCNTQLGQMANSFVTGPMGRCREGLSLRSAHRHPPRNRL